VNAALLLVTMIAGADTPPANTAPTKPAPVYSVGTAGCCGGGCSTCGDCGCGCESEGFFSKLKARLHHGSSCGGDCGCGCESEGFFSKLKGHGHHSDCGCDTGCGGCGGCDTGCGHGGGLGEKLRGLFHRHSDCGCGDCGGCGYGGVITTAPGGTMKAEPIGSPKKEDELKKLPKDDKTNPEKNPEKKPGSVQLIPQPVDVPALQITPTNSKSPF
jgi:hypothetical protein